MPLRAISRKVLYFKPRMSQRSPALVRRSQTNPARISLKSRKALVTGGSSGIGQAIAIELARREADVGVVYSKSQAGAQGTKRDVEKLGVQCEILQADLRTPGCVSPLLQAFSDQLGKLPEIAVHAAGTSEDGLLFRKKVNDIEGQLRLLLQTPIEMTRELLIPYKRAIVRPPETPVFGIHVYLTSVLGQVGEAGLSIYTAAKGGLNAFAKSLAAECGPCGLRFIPFAPGLIDTPMTQKLSAQRLEAIQAVTPVRRSGRPEEVALAVVDAMTNGFFNGEVISLSGGLVR